MNALRRQLSATAWQAVGFFGASLVFALVVFLWGQHIEGRIDTVVVQRQRDHQTLHRLAIGEGEAVARELQANSKSVQNLEQGSGGAGVPSTGGSGEAPAPGNPVDSGPDQPTKPNQPRHHPPPAPHGSGSEGVPQPQAAPQTIPSPAPIVNPAGKEVPAEPKGLLPATLEGTGEVVGAAVDKAEGAVNQTGCAVRALLKPCP